MIRILLVLACVVVLLAVLVGMAVGWRRRGARQEPLLGALPATPADLGQELLPPTSGLYVGSTFANSWQDRVVAGGLGRRAAGSIALLETGVLIARDGETSVFLPRAAVVSARLAPGLAGKVVGAGGLLVVRWRVGDHELDSGFRADDKRAYIGWIKALQKEDA